MSYLSYALAKLAVYFVLALIYGFIRGLSRSGE